MENMDSIFLADNLHWDNDERKAARIFDELIARNEFPLKSDAIVVILVQRGVFTLVSAGTRLVVGSHDALVMLSGQILDGLSISADCRLLSISLTDPQSNLRVDLDDANQILRHTVSTHQPLLFHLSSREYKACEKLFFSAKEFVSLASENARKGLVAGYARIISSLIADKIAETDSGEAMSAYGAKSILPVFLENVRVHCRKERNVEFYSAKASLTPKYFSKIIKLETGKSAATIIREYTMAEARMLLSTKKYSVKEVSGMLHFSGPSSFCKYFKAAQGCPPGEYMKNN